MGITCTRLILEADMQKEGQTPMCAKAQCLLQWGEQGHERLNVDLVSQLNHHQ